MNEGSSPRYEVVLACGEERHVEGDTMHKTIQDVDRPSHAARHSPCAGSQSRPGRWEAVPHCFAVAASVLTLPEFGAY